jgi:hypothetical protein
MLKHRDRGQQGRPDERRDRGSASKTEDDTSTVRVCSTFMNTSARVRSNCHLSHTTDSMIVEAHLQWK